LLTITDVEQTEAIHQALEERDLLPETHLDDPELRAVYGKLLHEVYFRLDHAMQGFFRRLAESEKKPGFPRFKPRHQFFTCVTRRCTWTGLRGTP
jgi:hypothetical protein